jgi:peptidyl-prolyl cis-trans isomerase C
MNRIPRHVLSLAALVVSLGASPAVQAQNAAIVNGKAIPSARVDEFVKTLTAQGRPDSPDLRKAVRDELIAREIFSQEAEKKGLTRNAEVQRQLEAARQDILIRALIRDELKRHPVTDADVKAKYDELAKSAAGKEYKARHILVETDAEARAIIEQLKKGTAFEELAKKSKDPGSAARGGDLDWAAADGYVAPFAEALQKLQKAQLTEVPVKSEFGYHVIRVDDIRTQQPPPLEQVKPQILQELERQKIMTMQQELRARAKVQ